MFTDWFDHQFIGRTVEILERYYPQLTIEQRDADHFRPARMPGRVVVHLQWIDFVLRRDSLRRSVRGMCRLTFWLVALRLTGVRIVWTVHNPIGKAHSRQTLDRIFRSGLTLICSQFVVLNEGAATVTTAELLPPVRRRFRQRVHVVPMPMDMRHHGGRRPMSEVRAELGIDASIPIVAYLRGAAQPDRAGELRDPSHRFELISVQRDVGDFPGLQRVAGGWQFRGRPADEEYGALLCAADAVVLADDRAFGSMTLHAAVELRRPVISPACPAVEELAALGGAVALDGDIDPDAIADALERLDNAVACAAFEEFERRHSDARVACALGAAYRAAGLEHGMSPVIPEGQQEVGPTHG